MYRCQVCQRVSRPKDKRHVHQVNRQVKSQPWSETSRLEILRELTVCNDCHVQLSNGILLEWLLAKHQPAPVKVQVEQQEEPVITIGGGDADRPVEVLD